MAKSSYPHNFLPMPTAGSHVFIYPLFQAADPRWGMLSKVTIWSPPCRGRLPIPIVPKRTRRYGDPPPSAILQNVVGTRLGNTHIASTRFVMLVPANKPSASENNRDLSVHPRFMGRVFCCFERSTLPEHTSPKWPRSYGDLSTSTNTCVTLPANNFGSILSIVASTRSRSRVGSCSLGQSGFTMNRRLKNTTLRTCPAKS
ncbi:hypothetical protein C8Q74DRAFT_530966 [Fomes fomentarius]|nr:hypothetical protein C8Q74DRAFT_530966 [Fomes fomentarius]